MATRLHNRNQLAGFSGSALQDMPIERYRSASASRRSTSMRTHFADMGMSKFEDDVLAYFSKTRQKLNKFMKSNSYLDLSNSDDSDCFEFCICFARELCSWSNDDGTGSVIKRINENCKEHRERCFPSGTRKLPPFAQNAKDLLEDIAEIQERVAEKAEMQGQIKDLQTLQEQKSLRNAMLSILSSVIKSVIKVILAMVIGIAVIYLIHFVFIKKISEDPLFQEFDARATELLKTTSLHSQINNTVLLLSEGSNNIISDGQYGKVTDDKIMKIGASIYVSTREIIEKYSYLVQTTDNRCLEVKWATSEDIMRKFHEMMKKEVIFKFKNKKIRRLPENLSDTEKLSLLRILQDIDDSDIPITTEPADAEMMEKE